MSNLIIQFFDAKSCLKLRVGLAAATATAAASTAAAAAATAPAAPTAAAAAGVGHVGELGPGQPKAVFLEAGGDVAVAGQAGELGPAAGVQHAAVVVLGE